MIDVTAFTAERERLRRFCFRRTSAAIVIRDISACPNLPNDPVSRVAEVLQILLAVDAKRFADPDDNCENVEQSIFAFPTANAKQDVVTILRASKRSRCQS
jgi:hypothetical protein